MYTMALADIKFKCLIHSRDAGSIMIIPREVSILLGTWMDMPDDECRATWCDSTSNFSRKATTQSAESLFTSVCLLLSYNSITADLIRAQSGRKLLRMSAWLAQRRFSNPSSWSLATSTGSQSTRLVSVSQAHTLSITKSSSPVMQRKSLPVDPVSKLSRCVVTLTRPRLVKA